MNNFGKTFTAAIVVACCLIITFLTIANNIVLEKILKILEV